MKKVYSILFMLTFTLFFIQFYFQTDKKWKITHLSNKRLNEWIERSVLTSFKNTDEIKITEILYFSNTRINDTSQLTLYPHGRFTLSKKSLIEGFSNEIENYDGFYSIQEDNIFYAWKNRFYKGKFLTLNVDYSPTTIVFNNTIFKYDLHKSTVSK